MNENNLILNRFFTQNVFLDMIHSTSSDNKTYQAILQKLVDQPEQKENLELIKLIYKFMSKSYRNEYFYQNTLVNKLLLGRHSLNTTTALTQIPISKSKADFILINGKAVVYEIKTELDTFERLEKQFNDYYKAFDHVCLVTSEQQYQKALALLEQTPVGICVLTDRNTISLRKKPRENRAKLDYTTLFKVLHKKEFEAILLQYYGCLPEAPQVFYYGECLKQFCKIPLTTAYTLTLRQLKQRNQMPQALLDEVPYELKSLFYFAKVSKNELQQLQAFLNQNYGG